MSERFELALWPLSSAVSDIVSLDSLVLPRRLTLCHPLSSVFRNAENMADNENTDEAITIDSDDDDLEVTHYATPNASSMTPLRRV